MNSTIADTLCTAVTIGFLKSNPETRYIVEKLRDEQDQGADHADLCQRLNHVGVHARLSGYEAAIYHGEVVIASQLPKPEQPLIITKIGRPITNGEIEQIGERLRPVTQYIETETANLYQQNQPLYGAYIGGVLTGALNGEMILNIRTPSNLYIRTPFIRGPLNEAQENSLCTADQVRIQLANLLTRLRDIQVNNVIAVADTVSDAPLVLPRGFIFSSCHGLIASLFSQDTPPDAYYIEYSLGASTNKVASCLPCSMFAESNHSPAHATHFGRGDNWNFPQEIYDIYYNCIVNGRAIDTLDAYGLQNVRNWHNNITAWYLSGMDSLLTANIDTHGIGGLVGNAGLRNIPLFFLDALTFERGFLERIIETIPL